MSNIREKEVDANIDLKHAILVRWCKDLPWKRDLNGDPEIDGSGKRTVEYFPNSMPRFALWDGSQNSEFARANELRGIKRVSLGSLDQPFRSGQKKAVDATLKLLKSVAMTKRERLYRGSEIAELKAENKLLKALVQQQERDVAEFTRRLGAAERDLRGEQRAHQRILAESRRRNSDLEKQVAELTTTVNKVQGLKGHGRKD